MKGGNFEALLCADPIFTALKVLNLFKNCNKNQKASYNFKLGFALSNRPHFDSVYLVRVPFLNDIAVCDNFSLLHFRFNNRYIHSEDPYCHAKIVESRPDFAKRQL